MPARKKLQVLSHWLLPHRYPRTATVEGKIYLFIAIDRTLKFPFVQLATKANHVTAPAFIVALINAVPYKIHAELSDNGIQFRLPSRYSDGPIARIAMHMVSMRCHEIGIEHRCTKNKHPWANGQVESMNRNINDATVKVYHYDDHLKLRRHLSEFMDVYNFRRRLNTLGGLTPYEFICRRWTIEPERFLLDPIHRMTGLTRPIHRGL